MRTLTVKASTASKWNEGWHTLDISNAKYGDYNGTKFIDVMFKDYPESLNLRVYSKNGEDGEEFAIGRLFRFANAGITSVSKSQDGESIVQIDDTPTQLVGKKINVFFYKDGEYNSILSNIAPVPFTNDLESFKEEDVKFWKTQAEKYYNNYIKKDNVANGEVKVVDSATDNAMPW